MKRLLLAAIAVSVMVGCTDDQHSEITKSGSDIPVNIEYVQSAQRARTAEESHGIAKVTEINGNVKECILSMSEGTLAGVITDVDCEELVEVSIELFDKDGNLTYKGKDIVEKVNDSLYECANSDLYAVDEQGKIILDEGVIHDINGSKSKMSDSSIGQFLALLMESINLNDETQGQITEAVLDREWSESELLLIEQFIYEIHDVIKTNGSILIWDKDTVDVMETGLLYSETELNTNVLTIATQYNLNIEVFTSHLVDNSDFYNLPWYEGQQEAVNAFLELEAKKLETPVYFYKDYGEVKDVCYEMSEAANVDYIVVADTLGSEFWKTFCIENDSSVVNAKIAEVIAQTPQKEIIVIDTGFYSSYDEVKQASYDMSLEADVDHSKVMDELGEKFWEHFWKSNNISEVNKEIKSVIAKVKFFESIEPDPTIGGYYDNIEEVKELTYDISKTYGANHEEVVELLGNSFFESFWKTNIKDTVIDKVMSAIKKVNFLDSQNPDQQYHYSEKVRHRCSQLSQDALLKTTLVEEKLGNEFFESYWKENSRKDVDAKIKEAIAELKVEFADYFTDYSQVKDLCYELSVDAGVDYTDVMDLLGDDFWDNEWQVSTRDEINARFTDVITQIKDNQ